MKFYAGQLLLTTPESHLKRPMYRIPGTPTSWLYQKMREKWGGVVLRGTSYTGLVGERGGETEHHFVRRFPGFARSSFW
jgi:hypothetical protein